MSPGIGGTRAASAAVGRPGARAPVTWAEVADPLVLGHQDVAAVVVRAGRDHGRYGNGAGPRMSDIRRDRAPEADVPTALYGLR